MPSRPLWDIVVPSVFESHEGPSLVRSRSAQWQNLRPEFRKLSRVTLPADQFSAERRVRDEVSYRINRDHSLSPMKGDSTIGSVVIVLESPHKAEFDESGRALGPLRHPPSREVLEAYLPELLGAAEKWQRDVSGDATFNLADRQILLGNAVQYQTSLQALMTDPSVRLQTAIRDCIWKTLFAAGGAAEFINRVDALDPALVLLAPTSGVRRMLAAALRASSPTWPWRFIDRHPSCWGMKGPQLRSEVEYRHCAS